MWIAALLKMEMVVLQVLGIILHTVNSKTFATGDGLYFKVGTTCYLNSDNDRVRVRWNGTGENNRAIIGHIMAMGFLV
jgi:hypothetical protein